MFSTRLRSIRFLRIASVWIAMLMLAPIATVQATRVIAQPEDAHELFLDEIVLPRRVTDSVSFRTCGDCPTIFMRVDAATRYLVNGMQRELAEFLEDAERLRADATASQRTVVGVYFDKQSRIINRIEVDRF